MMTKKAVRIGNELLKQQRQFKNVNQFTVEQSIIFYNDLCKAVSTGRKKIGRPLLEIAKYCQTKKLPPLNALAVSKQTHEPSKEYDRAGGFRLKNWCIDVRKCLACRKYPKRF